VRLGSAHAREREAVADLDAFHGLDPHEGRSEPRIEPIGLLRVRAEARRRAGGHDLDDPAERVAVRASGVGRCFPVGLLAADLEGPPGHLDADLGEKRFSHRAGRDLDRGLPRARPLERVPDVVVAELQRSGEVGVARAGQGDRCAALPGRLAGGRPRAHPPLPASVVAIADDERQRRAERHAVPEACEDFDLVLLEPLARAAAVALASPVEVGGDRLALEAKPGRQAADDGDERGAV
jgi:hypothetical protein